MGMTATERLRALLDERGVEWWEGWDKDLTLFDGADGIRWIAEADYMLGELFLRSVLSITPEQAIAATLDSCNCSNNCTNGERTETCHPVISDNLMESEGTGDAWADCSECGHLLFVLTDPNSQVPNFCPNCGRNVVDDG